MKITFTGITKEEAVSRLQAAAADNRAHAARMRAMECPEKMVAAYKKAADDSERKAAKCDAFADTIMAADGDSISIADKDEGLFHIALASGESTFCGADSMYTITPEDVSEIPFGIMLAIGEAKAAKTE